MSVGVNDSLVVLDEKNLSFQWVWKNSICGVSAFSVPFAKSVSY